MTRIVEKKYMYISIYILLAVLCGIKPREMERVVLVVGERLKGTESTSNRAVRSSGSLRALDERGSYVYSVGILIGS